MPRLNSNIRHFLLLDSPAISMATASLPVVSTPARDLLDKDVSLPVNENHGSNEKGSRDNIQICNDNDPHVSDSKIARSPTRNLRGPVGNFGSWFRSDFWQLELLSFFITLVCFACLIMVLRQSDNKSLPSLPSGLTLNTVVSWISTVHGPEDDSPAASWIVYLRNWLDMVQRTE